MSFECFTMYQNELWYVISFNEISRQLDLNGYFALQHHLNIRQSSLSFCIMHIFTSSAMMPNKPSMTAFSCTMTHLSFVMASWHGDSFLVTGPLWGESTVYRWISPHKGPVMRGFDGSVHGCNVFTVNKWSRQPDTTFTAYKTKHN